MEKLTKRQQDVLTYIKKFIISNGYSPTVREIGKGLGLSSPATIQAHLNKLKDKGYISKHGSKNRTIDLNVKNEFDDKVDEVAEIALLGSAAAGDPIEAINMPDETIKVPSYLIPKGKNIFALTVDGDSMQNVGIYHEDVVLVEKKSSASNSDIVVALLNNNEVTIKRYFRETEGIRLQPENDSLKPIISKDIKVIGKVIGLYRKI